jgi:hypothetical protein
MLWCCMYIFKGDLSVYKASFIDVCMTSSMFNGGSFRTDHHMLCSLIQCRDWVSAIPYCSLLFIEPSSISTSAMCHVMADTQDLGLFYLI